MIRYFPKRVSGAGDVASFLSNFYPETRTGNPGKIPAAAELHKFTTGLEPDFQAKRLHVTERSAP
jgi:hypothetical protein